MCVCGGGDDHVKGVKCVDYFTGVCVCVGGGGFDCLKGGGRVMSMVGRFRVVNCVSVCVGWGGGGLLSHLGAALHTYLSLVAAVHTYLSLVAAVHTHLSIVPAVHTYLSIVPAVHVSGVVPPSPPWGLKESLLRLPHLIHAADPFAAPPPPCHTPLATHTPCRPPWW